MLRAAIHGGNRRAGEVETMATDPRGLTSRILVPLDGSDRAEQALPYALAIGGPESEVILLAVVPRATNVRNVQGTEIAPAERVQEGYRGVAEQALDRAASWLGGRRTVRRETAHGDPAEQIVRTATERGVGLIVMTAMGRGTFAGWALGSTTDRVTRAATQPVMVVHRKGATDPPGAGAAIGGLVVPVDGSELAARALPVAATIARSAGVPVRVVHAVRRDDAQLGEVPAEADAEAQRTVATAVADLRSAGASASGAVISGEPASGIVSVAGVDDVVVMTSHGESGAGGWVLGGVADKLLRHGSVSVVLVPSSGRGGGAA
jgi:nucleotide-binding universal stress UspA family protein